jgi:hypothetical protein
MIPRLDPKEVAAVFTAPFHSFLKKEWDEQHGPPPVQKDGRPEKWYRGAWTDWHESRWRMHNFYIPRPPPTTSKTNPAHAASKPRASAHGHGVVDSQGRDVEPDGDDPRPATSAVEELSSFRVFGMTARILVDAARVAYGEEPDFEHNSHFGDEEMLGRLLKMGRLSEKRAKGEVLTNEVLREASKI